jgi:hypothetical protein
MSGTISKKQSANLEIPRSIQVGPFKIDIKLVDKPEKMQALIKTTDRNPEKHDDDDDYHLNGLYDADKQAIYIDQHQAPGMMAETLFHEMLHAIWGVVGGWSSEIDEERVVSMMSATILDTLKRNEDLGRYFLNS